MSNHAGYRFLDHMTDEEVEAYGGSLDEAFENAGRAIEASMVDLNSIRTVEKKEINVKGRDLQSLLYAWIEALISLQDTDGLLFSDFKCKISGGKNSYILSARLRGEKFDPARHEQKTAIKAPTYHDMKISVDEKRRVTMRFLVDL